MSLYTGKKRREIIIMLNKLISDKKLNIFTLASSRVDMVLTITKPSLVEKSNKSTNLIC